MYGPARSLAILGAMAGVSVRIAAPPEMHFIQRIARLADYWGELADDEVFRRVITETVQPPVPWLEQCGFDPSRIFERARGGPRTYAAVLEAVLSDFAERQGKVRWSEKTPRQPPGPLWRHFPSAQVVHIVRDPRPTIASTMAKLGAFTDPVVAARAWRRFTEDAILAGARRGPSQYLRIRYEDLSREPEPVLRQVFAFLGEDFDPDVVSDLSRRRTAVPTGTGSLLEPVMSPITAPDDSTWRNSLPRWQRARVAAVVRDDCLPLGYEPPQESTVRIGRLLNAVHAPVDGLRTRRQQRQWLSMTPEMRYQQTIREQVERVQRGADRRSAKPAGRT